MKRKFWNWIQNQDESGSEMRTLFLNGEISDETWYGDEVTPKIFKDELNMCKGPISVWINSPGGDVFAAAQIYNMLMDYQYDVTVKIDGLAASAASVIAMAGTTVEMSPVAMMMIHNPATIAIGDSEEMKKAVKMLDEVKESIMNAYEIKTGLARDKISKLMDAESWFNAKKAVELGFADKILFADGQGDVTNDAGKIGIHTFKPLDNGYRFVWEFTPSQGNGTIAAVALTSKQGGVAAYGSMENSKAAFYQIMETRLETQTVEELAELFSAVEVDFENNILISMRFQDSSVIIHKRRLPVFTLGLNDRLNDTTNDLLEEKVISCSTFKFLGSYTPYGDFLDGHDGYWYGFANQANSSGDAKMYWVKIKKDDYTMTEGVWTLSNACLKAIGSFKVDTYAQRSVRGDLAAKVTNRLGGGETEVIPSGMQAREFQNLTEAQVIAKVGALFTADQKQSGILASISMAQFILESGYGKSELAQGANNCFGMKKSLSGNTWCGSTWDGSSVYTKKTQEQNADGSYMTITTDFRRYSCVEDSIADHSAYLLGAKKGSKPRYDGLKGCTDYKKAAQIIKDGGYATSLTYVDKLCSIIEGWKLTQYDVAGEASDVVKYYRVRKSWEDAKSQLGAYTILANAKAMADKHPGYEVYDWNGRQVYPEVTEGATSGMSNADCPFLVKVSISDLNIRKGAGTNTAKTGAYTGVGVFTILEVKDGKGADAGWGKLKSGAGWISLDYCQRV